MSYYSDSKDTEVEIEFTNYHNHGIRTETLVFYVFATPWGMVFLIFQDAVVNDCRHNSKTVVFRVSDLQLGFKPR